MGCKVAIINESSAVSDADLKKIVAALQVQVGRDYAPVWGRYAQLTFVPKGGAIPADMWWLAVLDDPDQADALGYHETTDDGLPCGKVFAKADLQDGSSVSVTISHELLEMLGNPWVFSITFDTTANVIHQFFMQEMCDPCEADSLGYPITVKLEDGTTAVVQVSDFVTPAWFETSPPPNSKFTFMGSIPAPLTIAPGGYMSIYDADKKTWLQKTENRQHPSAMKELHHVAKKGTRKHRIAHRHRVWRASKRLAKPATK